MKGGELVGQQMRFPAEAVVQRHGGAVYRMAYSMVRSKSDADDIFQEVFLRYVRKRPAFESEEHCKAWLLRVTANCAKKYWASAWVRRTEGLSDSLSFTLPEESAVDAALRELSPKDRSIIHLFYYEGYSTAEIAAMLGLRESTARTRLTRARARLRGLLKGESDV